MASKFVVV